eukprot:GHVS01006008.1.p1 GENE.GHVS01006008.1~~GHVS01006008.1.p1  ORF type:complete len:629 (-),score=166.50 GHVS01006008.1:175-2061(-)
MEEPLPPPSSVDLSFSTKIHSSTSDHTTATTTTDSGSSGSSTATTTAGTTDASNATATTEGGCGVSFTLNPFLLLRDAIKHNRHCEIVSATEASPFPPYPLGTDVVVFRDHNVYLNAATPAGYSSSRKGTYTLADLYYFFRVPKSSYTFTYIAQKGCRYVSVLEKHNLLQCIEAEEADEMVTATAEAAGLVDAQAIDDNRDVIRPGLRGRVSVMGGGRKRKGEDEEDEGLEGGGYHPDGRRRSGDVFGEKKSHQSRGGSLIITTDVFDFFFCKDKKDLETSKDGLYFTEDNNNSSSYGFSGGSNATSPMACRSSTNGGRGGDIGAEAIANERPMFGLDRMTVVPGYDFSKVVEMYIDQKPTQPVEGGGAGSSGHRATAVGGTRGRDEESSGDRKKHKADQWQGGKGRTSAPPGPPLITLGEELVRLRRNPIIVVPTGSTVLVNKHNVRELLLNGKFVEPDKAAKHSLLTSTGHGGGSGADVLASGGGGVVVKQTPTYAYTPLEKLVGNQKSFHIVDSIFVDRFSAKDWAAVIAVLVQPGKWQFQNWPFKNRLELFVTVRGFFFSYENGDVPEDILNSKVKVFRLSRFHRHMDSSVMTEFWRTIEETLSRPRKNHLDMEKLKEILNRRK